MRTTINDYSKKTRLKYLGKCFCKKTFVVEENSYIFNYKKTVLFTSGSIYHYFAEENYDVFNRGNIDNYSYWVVYDLDGDVDHQGFRFYLNNNTKDFEFEDVDNYYYNYFLSEKQYRKIKLKKLSNGI